MKKTLLIFLIVLITACQKPPEQLIKKQYFIFGTIVEVLVWHNDKQLVDKALTDVETELNGMHTQWHAWKPGRLHEVNKAIRNAQSFNLTEEEARFIKLTAELSKKSLGNFNPASGQLINLWGFHTEDYPMTEPPPNQSDILKYLENMPVMADIIIENDQITSQNSLIWLDFGGVAKGYAIDKAINILKNHGIINAIVNAGGDLRSIGSKGDKNWQVAIRKPNSDEILAVISVQGDESIFTSGNYERYKEFKGKRYAHIINPKTGYGVKEIVSATVITDNGTKADAAATALIVAGTKDWHKVALSMQLYHVLLLKADGLCFATEKMMQRLEQSDLKCAILEM
jgi:thiamine biosynthesis lipoprotein